MCDKSTFMGCKEEEERISIAGTGKRKIQQYEGEPKKTGI
jgi:hypothetical protein